MNRGYEFSVGDGWIPIVQKAVDFLEARGAEIDQIKEKYGGLRLYYHTTAPDYSYEELDVVVRKAEEECARTCEICGEPGESRSGGWIKTLCDKHEEERQARYKR